MNIRLFIASKIILDPSTKKHISSIRSKLHRENIKWVNTDIMHITYKFLGDTDEQLLPDIKDQLQEIAAKFPKTSLILKGMGVFPSPFKPRVLWLGFEENNILTKLAESIDKQLEQLGFETENRPFKPHLTLGRIKYLKDKNTLLELLKNYQTCQFQEIPINQITLFKSQLTPSGPIYTPLANFELQQFITD
jgi:2'-5' RNA ligase